ncbi:hypothetical protein ACS0TY_013936 [Phlomoides rotata]
MYCLICSMHAWLNSPWRDAPPPPAKLAKKLGGGLSLTMILQSEENMIYDPQQQTCIRDSCDPSSRRDAPPLAAKLAKKLGGGLSLTMILQSEENMIYAPNNQLALEYSSLDSCDPSSRRDAPPPPTKLAKKHGGGLSLTMILQSEENMIYDPQQQTCIRVFHPVSDNVSERCFCPRFHFRGKKCCLKL